MNPETSARKRILFIERQPSGSVSIERVFAEIRRHIPEELFDLDVQKLSYGNGLAGIIKNLLTFRKNNADIYHLTGHAHYMALVLPANKTVLTVHDLVFLHNRTGVRRHLLKKLFLDWPVRKLRHLTAVSQATKDEIVSHCPDSSTKVTVIENPLIGKFLPGEPRPFNAAKPVILQIGTTPNKNVPRLIAAISGLACRLRMIGRLDDNIRLALEKHATDHESVDAVGESEIIDEYRRADMVSFCSTYEGFGLPIIEAQAMGKPVVTSDLEPMRSVAGNGAILIDPHDISGIRQGILRLIEDENFRDALIERGSENVTRFEPQAVAMRYCKLYQEMLSGQ